MLHHFKKNIYFYIYLKKINLSEIKYYFDIKELSILIVCVSSQSILKHLLEDTNPLSFYKKHLIITLEHLINAIKNIIFAVMNETFSDLGLQEEIVKAISEMGYEEPTPIQSEAIKQLLENKEQDLVALAQTGTGKTAAFSLPILNQIDTDLKKVQVLILSPTRELGIQIEKNIVQYSKYLNGVKSVAVYGGSSIDNQIRAIKRGVNIVVGTPGRTLDLIRRKKLDFSAIRFLVLDEADEMLSMGFSDDLNSILEGTPEGKQTLLFSATMPGAIRKMAAKYMTKPHEITIGHKNTGAKNVVHNYYVVKSRDRYQAIKRIVDFHPKIYGIIFCRTRQETKDVADSLLQEGYNADALHGDMSQAQREYVMNRFRKQQLQLLVATDVAARGVDVEDLTHVINYNLPDDPEIYVHRSGRTGRAGKEGISICIVHGREQYKLKTIEKMIGKTIEQKMIPSGMEICGKQLVKLIDKMKAVEVREAEITEFLPQITEKLAELSREELVKKFVSIEFNRFLQYYDNAPDLNISGGRDRDRGDRGERRGRDRGERGERRGDRRGRDRGERSERGGDRGARGDFARFHINIGKTEGATPKDIIGLINRATNRSERVAIGQIEILKSFAFFEVDETFSDKITEGFKGMTFNDIDLEVELSKPKKSGGGRHFESRGGGDAGGGGKRRRRDSGSGGSDRPKRSRKRPKDKKRPF